MPGLGQLKQEIATQVSHRRLGFWLALLFAAFVFGLLPFTFRMMHSYDDAVMVDARIIAVDRDPASGETRMTSEFIDLTGKAHRATESAAYHYAPGEPEVGQKIAYFYRPDAAGDIYGTPRADGLLKWLFGGAGALLALIASALAWYVGRHRRLRRRLLSNARAVPGAAYGIQSRTIVIPTKYSQTVVHTWRLKARCFDPERAEFVDYDSDWHRGVMPELPAGVTVTPVLFDPGNPRRYWLPVGELLALAKPEP